MFKENALNNNKRIEYIRKRGSSFTGAMKVKKAVEKVPERLEKVIDEEPKDACTNSAYKEYI